MSSYAAPAISGSATASFAGTAIDARQMFRCSAQVLASGAVSGSARVQASNDNPPGSKGRDVKNWTDIMSTTVPVNGAGSYLIPSTELSYFWIRVAFSASASGSAGSLVANLKSVGG